MRFRYPKRKKKPQCNCHRLSENDSEHMGLSHTHTHTYENDIAFNESFINTVRRQDGVFFFFFFSHLHRKSRIPLIRRDINSVDVTRSNVTNNNDIMLAAHRPAYTIFRVRRAPCIVVRVQKLIFF